MDETLLTELIRRTTATSVVNVITRTVDTVAEEMARDILREPAFRDAMRELVRVAFNHALTQLNEPRTGGQP
jgi:hypothetical protein